MSSSTPPTGTRVTSEVPVEDIALSAHWVLETSRHLWHGSDPGSRQVLIRAVLDSLTAHTAVLDADGTIVAVNKAWIESSRENGGNSDSTGVGINYLAVCSNPGIPRSSDASQADAGIRAVLSGSVRLFQMDYPCDLLTERRWFNLQVVPLLLPSGGAVVSHTNITERKRLEAQLEHQALHDPLTGLPNRLVFKDRLDLALARAGRTQGTVGVMFLDLDRFRIVNDNLGRLEADQLLIQVGQRLRKLCRPEYTVARFGADEFGVLCEEIGGPESSLKLADALVRSFAEPFNLAGRCVYVCASIGIAHSGDGGALADNLFRDADAALHRAKHRGGSRFEVFDQATREKAFKRLELETALRQAIERGELRVYYQPKINLRTGTIAGVEALVRWEHPERGMIGPADFIPVAEETGLVVPLGAWVLEESCRMMACLHAANVDRPPLLVAVNLSARQLTPSEFVQEVALTLRRTGIDPATVCLEITESAVMQDPAAAIAVLHELKGLGVHLAIDDFGTGYSSLSYLQRLPVDLIKIDQSFVNGLGTSAGDQAIVRAVISLAQSLGLTSVAEGVETAVQLAELRAMGCDLAQGYYFARPQPASSLIELLARAPCW